MRVNANAYAELRKRRSAFLSSRVTFNYMYAALLLGVTVIMLVLNMNESNLPWQRKLWHCFSVPIQCCLLNTNNHMSIPDSLAWRKITSIRGHCMRRLENADFCEVGKKWKSYALSSPLRRHLHLLKTSHVFLDCPFVKNFIALKDQKQMCRYATLKHLRSR